MARPSVYLNGTLPPCPDPFNAAEWCLGADVPGDRDAFIAVDPDKGVIGTWSFEALRAKVLRAAGALVQAGVQPADRVVLCLGDVPEFPVAYFGAIAAGAVATPLSSQLSTAELDAIIASVAPRVVLGGPRSSLPVAALDAGEPCHVVRCRPDDPALLVFTSGSGGRPKGVLHAHRAFWARQSMHLGWHGIRAGDRVMHAGAFNWTYTLGVGLADTWSVGATAILNAGRRDPEVWSGLAQQMSPSVFAAAPAVYRRILKYGTNLQAWFASLRHAVTAGEALSPVLLDAWGRATGKPLLEALGMSEVSTYVSTPPDRAAEPGVAGWPQPGRHVAVVDDHGVPVDRGGIGGLAVHRDDPGLFLRYWNDAELTARAFAGDWFLTGDLVSMRADGAITYAGRADDQMNVQGYRVDPGEVEVALSLCPGVSACAVRALDVKDGVSVVAGWVVAEPGHELTKDSILADISTRLAAYKCPRELFRVEALPRTANGKLVRRRLSTDGATRL